MNKINENIVAFLPIETIEEAALNQIKNTASMPFVFKHVAVMPDTHFGRGSTVGTVLPTKGAIIPAAVGVDIGCGVIAVKTTLIAEQFTPEILHTIRLGLERRIPMSAGKFNNKITESAQLRIKELEATEGIETADKLSKNWREQLGTLGGGNHFLELCVDTDNKIWATLHSGSRGVGNQIGQFYIKVAQTLCKDNFISLPDPDLAYLVEGIEVFNNYIRDMRWAQKFALLNREEMLDRFMIEIASVILGDHTRTKELEGSRINSHHNFTQIENHMGEDIWVTRKGAIKADIDDYGMIPGSMGTKSYIIKGKGNVPAFKSAPHGAGRNFSRGEARKRFTMEDFDKAMVGIEHRRTEVLLDEIPGAYKPIDTVMENAKDLVEVVTTLKQILNVKGD